LVCPNDVNDLIEGPNTKNYAEMWVGNLKDKAYFARESSPLSYVRKQNPPVITVHGDHDDVVPYSHAVCLHGALTKAGVINELFTIQGGGHGQFSPEDNRRGYIAIWKFLANLNLGPVK
jgi:dipeptidyl aminopeptidase/acylaminoacyl peptidase